MKKPLIALAAATAALCACADGWMGRIADGAFIDQLSIPGTHDSATGEGTSLDAFARTQDLSLAEQFEAGIRAFDLRPSVNGSTLGIYHGTVATKISFEEALTQFCSLLDENPTEFIIVIMRHEDDHENDSEKAAWSGLVADVLASEKFASRFIPFSQSLTVGETRGRILLLSRDKYASKPTGGFISSWTHSPDLSEQSKARITGASARESAKLTVQDYYEMKNQEQLDTEISAITALLDHSTTLHTVSGHQWVINHTSGYYASLFATADAYRKNAATTNRTVIDYLADENHAGPTGLIMMDFAGTDRSGLYDVNGLALTEAVIDNNFRYDMKGQYSSIETTMPEPSASLRIKGATVTAPGLIRAYLIDGTHVAEAYGTLTLDNAGLYIVTCGSETAKIAVR